MLESCVLGARCGIAVPWWETKVPGGRFDTRLSPKSMEQVCAGFVPKNTVTKKCSY